MRVVSLDFDGVTHPSPKCVPCRADVATLEWLDILAELLQPYPDVRLVVHSTWREVYSEEEIRDLLHPLEERFIGVVPPGERTEALVEWSDAHSEVAQLLVLDDESLDLERPPGRELVACNPRFGLAADDVRGAVAAWLERTDW